MNDFDMALAPHIRVHHASGPQGGAAALALEVADELRLAIQNRGKAVLSMSGGRSPVAMMQALSRCVLPWSEVTITLVDDRQVPQDHPASNAGLVHRHLRQNQAVTARWVTLVGAQGQPLPSTPAQWAQRAETASQQLLSLGPADVVLLGMGTDGHFASIFPQADQCGLALDPTQAKACLSMRLDPLPAEAPFHRLTQTLAHLKSARRWILSVAGAAKLGVLRQALSQAQPNWPVTALLHPSNPPLTLWISP